MRTFPTVATVAALSLTLAACADRSAPTATLATAPRDAAFSAEAADAPGTTYLVRFRGAGIPSSFAGSVAAAGGELVFAHDKAGIAVVSGMTAEGAAALGNADGVAAVDEDAYTVLEQPEVTEVLDASTDLQPSDAPQSPANPAAAAFFGRQLWNLQAISAPAAWAAGATGSSSTLVGILDTGIDYLHPDLVGRVDLGLSRSFLSAAENARVPAGANLVADLNYHGTHVASTVASNAYIAAGVTTNVRLVGLKVCAPGTAANGFSGTCPTSGTLAAILYAADNGIAVINMSLGGGFNRRQASAQGGFGPSFLATINQVMNYARRNGTLVVVSAGNAAVDMSHNGNGYNTYCDAPAVVCVSATGPTAAGLFGTAQYPRGVYLNIQNVDALAYYSNVGNNITVAAPGGNAIPVWASCSGFTLHPGLAGCRSRFYNSPTSWSGSIVGLSGTSMAAPHVTGVAAVIAGQVGRNPAQIAARLQQSADDLGAPGFDPAYGHGRVNLLRAAVR
ncbi:MAG TPA: S8 family serine peptidase [Gemmatimonadaceae bacterium]